MAELIGMMVKVSRLSVREWEDLLDRILKKLGYISVSKFENENEMVLIADRGSDGKRVRICVNLGLELFLCRRLRLQHLVFRRRRKNYLVKFS